MPMLLATHEASMRVKHRAPAGGLVGLPGGGAVIMLRARTFYGATSNE